MTKEKMQFTVVILGHRDTVYCAEDMENGLMSYLFEGIHTDINELLSLISAKTGGEFSPDDLIMFHDIIVFLHTINPDGTTESTQLK